MMTDPPMMTLRELNDGTYSLLDIIKLNLIIQGRAEQAKEIAAK